MTLLRAHWMILMGLMMSGNTEYIFHFKGNREFVRIATACWNRIQGGEKPVKEYANKKIYIAYAYILLENRKPDYCPRVDGAIYYFDRDGYIIDNEPHYFDLLQDNDEETGGVISLEHRKKKKEAVDRDHWELKPRQIQQVLDCIWL